MNPATILERCHAAEESGDMEAARAHIASLEHLAELNAEAAFAAALAFQHGAWTDLAKHRRYLEHSAELGYPPAQLELAAAYAFGLNSFLADSGKYAFWISRAQEHLPEACAQLAKRVGGVHDG